MDTSGFSKLPTEIKQLIVPFSRLRDLASFRLLSPDALVATEKQSYELIKEYFPYLLAEKNDNHTVNYFELLIGQFKNLYAITAGKYSQKVEKTDILKYHLAALTGDCKTIIEAPISWEFKRLLHAIHVASGHFTLFLSKDESKKESKIKYNALGEYKDFCSITEKALIIASQLGNTAAVLSLLQDSSLQIAKGYALVEAVKNNHLSIVEALLKDDTSIMLIQMNFKRDDYYDEYDARKYSIRFAIKNKNYLILKMLLENQSSNIYENVVDGVDYNGEYYIEQAVEMGDVSIVRLILQLKFSSFALDDAIKKAEEKGFFEIVNMIKAHASCKNGVETKKVLEQKSLDIIEEVRELVSLDASVQTERKTNMLPMKIEGSVTSPKEERDSVCSSLRAGLHFLWSYFSTSGVANNEDKAEYGKTAGLSFTKNK